MASEEEKLGTKLTQLRLAAQRTGKILDTGKREAIERHLKALQTTISETDQQKRTVEAEKIGKKDDLADISDWNTEIEVKINEAEDEVNRLQKWLDGKRIEEENGYYYNKEWGIGERNGGMWNGEWGILKPGILKAGISKTRNTKSRNL